VRITKSGRGSHRLREAIKIFERPAMDPQPAGRRGERDAAPNPRRARRRALMFLSAISS